MLNLNKCTKKTKPKPKPTIMCTNCSYAYHCAQLSYTTQHRTVLIIFPFILQTIIIALMMSAGREGAPSYLISEHFQMHWCRIRLTSSPVSDTTSKGKTYTHSPKDPTGSSLVSKTDSLRVMLVINPGPRLLSSEHHRPGLVPIYTAWWTET